MRSRRRSLQALAGATVYTCAAAVDHDVATIMCHVQHDTNLVNGWAATPSPVGLQVTLCASVVGQASV